MGHKNEYEKKPMLMIFVKLKSVHIIDLKPMDFKITGEHFLNNILMAIEQS